MKKGFLILLTISMIATMTACGSSDDSTNEDSVNSEEEETAAEEKNTGTYKGIKYSYPSSWSYQESDEGVSLVSEDEQTMILLVSADLYGDGLTDDNLDDIYDLMLPSMTSGYDEVQDESTEDITIDGHKARETTATITYNGTLYNYDGAVVFDQDEQYVYGIAYLSNVESDGYPDVYQDLLNSIEFDLDLIGDRDQDTEAAADEASSDEASSDESVPSEYTAALNSAESYNKSLHMSKQGLYDQLTSEYGGKFGEDAAQYAVDNIDADWNANALASAESYNNSLHLSKQGMFDQLTSDYGGKFTEEEAQYAIDNLEADWNENALAAAKSYRDSMDMSSSKIHDQLTSDYGGKFTEEEADYAIEHLDD